MALSSSIVGSFLDYGASNIAGVNYQFYHWAIVALPFVFICILLILASGIGSSDDSAYSIYDSVASSQLKNRPLNFPALSAGARCPISHGSRDTVPRADYIFCAGCFWFGKGPVFFALSWSDQSTDEARFSLNKVPYEQRTYRAKTPWVSKPEYSGPILIRGRLLGGDAKEKLRFSLGGNRLTDAFQLEAPAKERANSSHWSFWPTGMFVPHAGCYGIQIDTSDATDVIILETTGPR